MSTSVADLRLRVAEQLDDARRAIARLRTELEASRAENEALSRDRTRLQRALVQMDLLQMEVASAEARARTCRVEYKRVEEQLADSRQDRGYLADRCATLERALARERAELDAARQEIRCLEEQMEQLRSIVALLSGETAPGRTP